MKDIELLHLLETNARLSTRDLSDILLEEEEQIQQRMESLEKRKIICGYHTLIDWDKTGTEYVNALIEVKVTPQRDTGFDKTAERICNYPEVSAVYLISGDFDMMVLIEGKTLQEVSKFVSSKLSPIEDVTGTSTQFVLKKYKDHGTIMFGQKKPERMLITP